MIIKLFTSNSEIIVVENMRENGDSAGSGSHVQTNLKYNKKDIWPLMIQLSTNTINSL
jgi:hypothetical protein